MRDSLRWCYINLSFKKWEVPLWIKAGWPMRNWNFLLKLETIRLNSIYFLCVNNVAQIYFTILCIKIILSFVNNLRGQIWKKIIQDVEKEDIFSLQNCFFK